LAETAVRLLQSDLNELGRKGREHVRTHHGWSMVFDRLFGLYRNILST
jgi:hypothetical protein